MLLPTGGEGKVMSRVYAKSWKFRIAHNNPQCKAVFLNCGLYPLENIETSIN